jgi:hypothetical protein
MIKIMNGQQEVDLNNITPEAIKSVSKDNPLLGLFLSMSSLYNTVNNTEVIDEEVMTQYDNFDFSMTLALLKKRYRLKRKSYVDYKYLVSINNNKHINCILHDGTSVSWIPTIQDILAEDWEVI